MPGYNTEQAGHAGILSVKLELKPFYKHQMISETAVNGQLQLEKQSRETVNQQLYKHAESFWNEYKSVHHSFQERRVSIYANTEDNIFMPVLKLVTPLRKLRGIESPNHALRFVSLIPFENVGGSLIDRNLVHTRFNLIFA